MVCSPPGYSMAVTLVLLSRRCGDSLDAAATVWAAAAADFGAVLYFALKVKLTVAGFPAATVTV